MHTSYSLAATTTGRLASTDPNIQNIPVRTAEGREIRKAFVAEPGNVLLSADYSQIELRILAHMANIPQLIEAFHEGQDIHALTASEMFDVPLYNMDPMTRRRAKAINFGIIYYGFRLLVWPINWVFLAVKRVTISRLILSASLVFRLT